MSTLTRLSRRDVKRWFRIYLRTSSYAPFCRTLRIWDWNQPNSAFGLYWIPISRSKQLSLTTTKSTTRTRTMSTVVIMIARAFRRLRIY